MGRQRKSGETEVTSASYASTRLALVPIPLTSVRRLDRWRLHACESSAEGGRARLTYSVRHARCGKGDTQISASSSLVPPLAWLFLLCEICCCCPVSLVAIHTRTHTPTHLSAPGLACASSKTTTACGLDTGASWEGSPLRTISLVCGRIYLIHKNVVSHRWICISPTSSSSSCCCSSSSCPHCFRFILQALRWSAD
jgi:hypothetical protein